jgi:leucyl aminopeptidase
MAIRFGTARSVPATAPVVAHGVTAEGLASVPGPVGRAELERLGFEAKAGQIQVLPHDGSLTVLVGLGAADAVDADALRKAAAAMAKALGKHDKVVTTLAADAANGTVDEAAAARAVAEGVLLGSYAYTAQKSAPKPPALAQVTLAGSTAKAVREAISVGEAIAAAQNLARDFVNEPGGSLTAPVFADRAAALAKGSGLKVKVMDEAAIRRAGLGGLLGVNRGSTLPPRLVQLTYEPATKAAATLAFVGKGLTFDSGGLSIKPGTGMETMKSDMGGGAAVIAAMSALAAVGAPNRVRAFVPMTDNMLGGDATRPGDVLKTRNGKTIEVLNTDAEGRLILADALALASEEKPDGIVDLATLTGACMVALGLKIAGLMGRDAAFVDQVRSAAGRAGERVWELPLPDDYKQLYESKVADMKNIAGPYGGSITAGLILQEFVGDGIPWAHLDIAGPSWATTDEPECPTGGTGFGVRTLIELACTFRKG